ncbi:MAG: (d)CMP kinase [Jatrophihabitantaceae bacterium]
MSAEADSAGSGTSRRPFAGVIAIDGPSGTGKSTVARGLASRLGARYLDTGAMYRAATLAVLGKGVPTEDRELVSGVVSAARIEIGTDPQAPSVRLDGVEVDTEIRSADVTGAVSAVSAVPAVRTQLVAAQRQIIEGGSGAIVVEGRDIGSVVWPQARPKIYLTADAQTRARRRAGELGPGADVDAVAADIARRDGLDSSRATSPLTRATDAVVVDTTDLEIDEVINRLVDMSVNAHE